MSRSRRIVAVVAVLAAISRASLPQDRKDVGRAPALLAELDAWLARERPAGF